MAGEVLALIISFVFGMFSGIIICACLGGGTFFFYKKYYTTAAEPIPEPPVLSSSSTPAAEPIPETRFQSSSTPAAEPRQRHGMGPGSRIVWYTPGSRAFHHPYFVDHSTGAPRLTCGSNQPNNMEILTLCKFCRPRLDKMHEENAVIASNM